MVKTMIPQPNEDSRQNQNVFEALINLNHQNENLNNQLRGLLTVIHPEIERQAGEAVEKQVNEKINPKIDEIKELASAAVENSRADTSHQHDVTKARRAKATHLTKQWIRLHHGDANYGGRDYFLQKHTQFMRAIGRMVTSKYRINVVNDVRQADYKKVMAWIPTLTLNDIAAWRVGDRLKALETLNKWEKRHNLPLTDPED